MSHKPSVLFLSGSIRENSFNKKIAVYAHKLAQNYPINPIYINLKDYTMPLYDGDIETSSGLPENARKLKKLFVNAHGLFIASPEYNSSYPALLKNTFDWISRPETQDEADLIAFNGKVACLVAVSPGARGGIRCLAALRILLTNMNVNVMSDQLSIGQASKVFDDNDNLIDSHLTNNLNILIKNLANLISS